MKGAGRGASERGHGLSTCGLHRLPISIMRSAFWIKPGEMVVVV